MKGFDDHLDNYGNPGINEPCDSVHPWYCDIHDEWMGCDENWHCPKCVQNVQEAKK
jgi:hypothetical protein